MGGFWNDGLLTICFSDLCRIEYLFWNGKHWLAHSCSCGPVPDHLLP